IAAPAFRVPEMPRTAATRSRPTWRVRARTLFASFFSARTLAPSALARMKYVPVAVPAGIVTVVAPAFDAPVASAGTARDPSATSAASSVVLVDRKKRVVDAPAGLDAARFAVVSEIEMFPPAAAYAGALSDEMRRSDPMRIGRVRVLLAS